MDNCLDLSSQDLSEISESDIKTKVKKLILDNNSITLLAPNICKKLSYLSSLSIIGNKLEILPPEIDILLSLREFYLDHNVLHELPNCIGKLKHLNKLHVTHNKLEKFPESLSHLQNLRELVADENKIQSLPQSFGYLLKLSYLSLNINNIKFLPENFGNLELLKKFFMRYNSLSSLPSNFQNLHSIENIDLSFNDLESLPDDFSSASVLKTVFISNNYLTVLPQWLSRLPKVTDLLLNHNSLQGNPFLDDFGDVCKCLKHLDLNGNKISALPSSFGNLSNLTNLSLGPEGKIKLTYYSNNITRLPDSFPLLSNLASLELDKNNLKELPSDFGCLSNLIYLNLSRNCLRILPDNFCKLHQLEKCLLSSNYLSSLPENFGLLSLLKLLKLNDNKLFELPESFEILKLEYLDLSYNKFKKIPPSIKSMKSLIQLNIHENVYNSTAVVPHGMCENCRQWDCQCQVEKDIEEIDERNSKHNFACYIMENEDDDLSNGVQEVDQELNAISMKNSESLSDSDWENEAYENPRSFGRIYLHPVETDKSTFVPSDIHAHHINRTEIWHCVEEGQFDDADL